MGAKHLGAKQSIRIAICLAFAAIAILPAAGPASAQAAPIRYVFGTNSYTDSKGQLWSPVPASAISASVSHHSSICTKGVTFTGTPDSGLYAQQIFTLGRLSIVGGARFIHNNTFGNTGVPRVALTYLALRGIDSVLFLDTFNNCRKLGWWGGEISWTLEDNDLVNRAIEVFGCTKYKTYRVYKKDLGGGAALKN